MAQLPSKRDFRSEPKALCFDDLIADKVCCVSGPHYSEFDPWLFKKKIKSTRKNIIKKEKEKDGEKDKDKRETEET